MLKDKILPVLKRLFINFIVIPHGCICYVIQMYFFRMPTSSEYSIAALAVLTKYPYLKEGLSDDDAKVSVVKSSLF